MFAFNDLFLWLRQTEALFSSFPAVLKVEQLLAFTHHAPASCSSSFFLLITAANVNNPWSLLFERVGSSFHSLSLHRSLSLLFSSLILRTDFHQACSMFNMTGFHGHHMQGLQRGDWFCLMGSDSESWPLEHSYSTYQMQDWDRGRWKCLPYCTRLPTLSLSCFFFL